MYWNGKQRVTDKYSIRESNDGNGLIIDPSFENIPADMVDDRWQLIFDTTILPDGYYTIIVNASDIYGNEGYEMVEFSIRNWAVVELLPFTENHKAGRTVPVKFSLKITEFVEPETQNSLSLVFNGMLSSSIKSAKAIGIIKIINIIIFVFILF